MDKIVKDFIVIIEFRDKGRVAVINIVFWLNSPEKISPLIIIEYNAKIIKENDKKRHQNT
jgi:hypothetical protein